jgi:hypothetical protein
MTETLGLYLTVYLHNYIMLILFIILALHVSTEGGYHQMRFREKS